MFLNLKRDFPFRGVQFKTELFAGLTVAMTMIPESLSFAILAGLSPLTGLYAAFLMGIVTSILGGRPGMVSGGAGATIIVMISLIAIHGVEYLFAAVVLGGLIQMCIGFFKWGKFVQLIPLPVMYGFLNGLAVVIFMAQLGQFKNVTPTSSEWLSGEYLYWMIGLVLATISIVLIFPKWTKAIPSSLIAILIISLLVKGFNIDTKLVKDIASVKGDFPPFHFPNVSISLETLKIILPYSLVMAAVGLIESLLTLNVVDEITDTKGNNNKEAVAQGVGNVVNGFFSGMGGCAMIAQTLVNLNAGARTRWSSLFGAFFILIIILIASPIIENIPMAALVGVMMIVAIKTFQWSSLGIIRKYPLPDILIGMIVAIITILLHNLALAVFVGVILSSLQFAWDSAKRIRTQRFIDLSGRKHYRVHGPLFFGSVSNFLSKFTIDDDPDIIIIDFKESRIVDMTAIDALVKIQSKYSESGKTIILKNLNGSSQRMIKNAKIQFHLES